MARAATGACVAAADEADAEEIGTPVKGAIILKDEVVSWRCIQMYDEYRSKNGARVDVNHGDGFPGGYTSCVEAAMFVDVGILIAASTDGKACIRNLNEHYVKTEIEPLALFALSREVCGIES